MRRYCILTLTLLFSLSLNAQKRTSDAIPSGVVQVRGDMIDIRVVERGKAIFPQHSKMKFGKSIPEKYVGREYAVSLCENQGVSMLRAGKKREIIIALHYSDLNAAGWSATGEQFNIGDKKQYFYKYDYKEVGEWIDIPAPRSGATSVILFAEGLQVADVAEPPGVVIAKSAELRNGMITNPAIVVLPDGNYLAACSGVFRDETSRPGASFFLSKDKGKSWDVILKNDGQIGFYNLFVHRGALYMIGTASKTGNVIIRRSTNNGKSWTYPEYDFDDGVLLTGRHHSAPVPIVVHQGRIWRAMETYYDGRTKNVFVMSASVDDDLMKASSWVSSNVLSCDKSWIEGNERIFKQWIEGNVVVAPNGKVVNVLRIDEEREGKSAAIVTVESPEKIIFDPAKDIVEMPGGGKKFTIRYDSASRRYWALTNAVTDKDRAMTHSGIYSEGIHCGLIRNHLTLISSKDLRKWSVNDTIITSNNPFFDGFQYVDWQFDGNDIVAVIRTAMGESRGLPTRQHDANMFLFRRVENFRKDSVRTTHIESLKLNNN